MKKVKQIVMMLLASLLAPCVWAAAPLMFDKYLTNSYQDTGWTVADADDLASRSFAGSMAGANVNSGNPLPSNGYYVTKQSDGTVTFEMQVKNNELKAILVRMQVAADGSVQIKGELAGYRASSNAIGTRCFSEDGTSRASGTSNANLGTAQNTADSYACGAVHEILSWSNASYVGQSGYSVNQGSYGPYRLLVPATTELPKGSTLRIKEISIARRDGYTDQKNVITVGAANDASKASDVNSVDTTNLLGGKTRIRYPFSRDITFTVGTEYPSYLLNQAGGGATANTMNIHVIKPIAEGADVYKQTNNSLEYCAIYEVKAEVVSIFTPDTSHDEDVSFVTDNAPAKALKTTITADNTGFGTNSDYGRIHNNRVAQIVNVTGSSAANTAMIFGGTPKSSEGTVNADIWMNVIGGTYGAIFGGSNCDNWGGARQSTITGNVVLEVGSNTIANNVLGGFFKDGYGPSLNGNIDVVIKDQAVVKGLIAGAGISAHNNNATYTGNIKVTVKNVQSDNTAGVFVTTDSSDYLVGGGVYGTNANSKENVTGNTSVVIDLASDATGDFVKNIIGGGFQPAGGASRGTPECKVSGNTSVSITAPAAVNFTGDIYAGGYTMGSGNVTVGGTASVTLAGGTYSGSIKSGTATGAKTLSVTDNITVKPNNTAISGFGSLTIASGKTMTLNAAADKALSLAVPGTGAIAKTGAGVLTLNDIPSGANYAVTVSEGSLDLRGTANGMTIVMDSEGGSLDVATSRPTVNLIAGLVHITATPEELVAGSLTLPVPQDAAEASKDKVKVYDSEANEVEILSVTKEGTTVTITLKTLPSINATTTISALNLADNASGLIIVEGKVAEADAFTVTFDKALPAGVTMEIQGFVKFAASNDVAIPYNKMTFGQNATLIFDSIEGYTIPEGASVIAGTASGTITNNGTLTIKGNSEFTLTNNGTLTIAGGTSTVTRAGDQSIKGTVNIESGAEFVNVSGDAVSYGTPGTIFNVRGALTMGTTRWTVGGASKINLYGGCTVTGATTGEGAFDLFRNGEIITVNRGADESISAVTIAAKIRARNGDANNASEINIADGMTLAVTGGFAYADRTCRVKRTGSGHLTGTIPLDRVTLIYSGTSPTVNSIPAHFVVTGGESTIEWHGYGSDGVCVNDSKDDPFITINSGSTLKIYGHDYSGWNGGLRDTGWIVNKGTLIFNNGTGTRFWREHIVFGNGATMKIDHGNTPILLYGGTGSETASQLMLPEGTASIVAGEAGDKAKIHIGNSTDGGYGTKGAGISVGTDAVLTIDVPVAGNNNAGETVAKWGAGRVNFKQDMSGLNGTITLEAGVIGIHTDCNLAANKIVNNDINKKIVVAETADEDGYIVYSLAQRDPTTVEIRSGDTYYINDTAVSLVDGDAVVVKTTWGNLWSFTLPEAVAGHTVTLDDGITTSDGINMKNSINANQKLVVNNGTLWLYENVGANAVISGTGVFAMWVDGKSIGDGTTISTSTFTVNADCTITINGAVEISSTTVTCNGTLKLVEGSTLKVASELASGKVTTDVAHKHVVFDEETKTYSIAIDQVVITVPSVDHTTVEVVGGTLVGNTITVDYGTAVTITYKPVDGYLMADKVVTIESATESTTITVPEGTTPQLIVATVNGTPYASLANAKDACTGGETIVIVSDMTLRPFATATDFAKVGCIEIAEGVRVSGYFPLNTDTTPLKINGTFNIEDGFSGDGQYTNIPNLSGTGKITKTWAKNPVIYVQEHTNWNPSEASPDCIKLSVAKSGAETVTYYYDSASIITALRNGTEVTNIGYTAETVPAGLAIDGDNLVLKTYTVELKTFDHTVCYAKINTGDEVEYTEALSVKHGDSVYFRYVAVEGYRITSTTTSLQYTNIQQNLSGGTYTIETELNTVTITIPAAPANTTVSVTVNGNPVTVENNTITVTIGATVVVTYTADEGYEPETTTTEFTAAAGTQPTINVPTNVKPIRPTAPVATVTTLVQEGLDAAYTFTMDAEESEETSDYYGEWDADFVVTFDKDVAAGSLKLSGQYDGNGEEWVDLTIGDVTSGTEIKLISMVAAQLGYEGLTVPYSMIRDSVQVFNCGVKNLDGNAGTKMTVKLVLSKDGETLVIGEPVVYTLVGTIVIPEEPTITEGELVVPTPEGTETVEIDGEVVESAKVPLDQTTVYTVTAKNANGEVIAESQIGVVVTTTKTGTEENKPTVAVAVPFTGATVANLLDTTNFADGDQLKAFINGAYAMWTFEKGKWTSGTTVLAEGLRSAPNADTTPLARGSAVWVTTTADVVAFGAYEGSAVEPEVVKGYNLIGNPMMTAITPEAKTVGDVLIPVGSTELVRYTVIDKGNGAKAWQRLKSVQSGTIPGTNIPTFKPVETEEDPSIDVGGSVWLIKE